MKVKLINENILEDYGKNLLKLRGVQDVDRFISPEQDVLEHWDLLLNIRDGVTLVRRALDRNKQFAIIVDSDTDGYTSAAIIYQYLKKLDEECVIDYYLHTAKQHGLEDMWQRLQDKQYDLIIIPDAGSNDSQYAEELKPTPILVIDHHIVEEQTFADNMIVINNQMSPLYINKDLSGAGMAFQFCRAMDYSFCHNWAFDYIDLAAIGVCGDMMSGLEIENQYLWKIGFKNIKNYFMRCLMDKQSYSMNGIVNPISVAFYIVPLINAMIRVGSMEEKERMFKAFIDGHALVPSGKRGEKGKMTEVALESMRECTNAKSHQDKYKEEAVLHLEDKIIKNELLDNKILFITLDEDDDFDAELNGLICMQLSAKYKRPTIIARLNNEGYVRGSMRGMNNSPLTSFKNFLTDTGLCEYVLGHDQAAGISISAKNVPKLLEIANEQLAEYNFGEKCFDVNFDRGAMATDIKDMIFDLEKYRDIWSQNCNEPLVYIHDLIITPKDYQIIGKNSDTCKIIKNGIVYMKFHANEMIEELKKYDQIRLEIVGRPNVNEWGGNRTPQLMIDAYQIDQDTDIDF